MKLYYSPNLNPRVAVAVARYLNAPVEYVRARPRRPDNTAAFRAINPNALVPVLAEGDTSLWETDAIACRLSAVVNSDFWRLDGSAPKMIQWISWAAYHLNAAGGVLYFERLIRPLFSSETAPAHVLEEAERAYRAHARVLDGALADRRWLLGDRVSYADFRAATSLPFADRAGMPLAGLDHIRRWRDQLEAIDAWRDPFQGFGINEALG